MHCEIGRELHGANKRAQDLGKSVRVYHDLTKRRLTLLNNARKKLSDQGLASAEVFAFADMNSNLKIRKNKRAFDFNTEEKFDSLFTELFHD